MCCSAFEYHKHEINGKCPECDEPTIDGKAADGCSYSPVVCKKCEHQPCDGSC